MVSKGTLCLELRIWIIDAVCVVLLGNLGKVDLGCAESANISKSLW